MEGNDGFSSEKHHDIRLNTAGLAYSRRRGGRFY